MNFKGLPHLLLFLGLVRVVAPGPQMRRRVDPEQVRPCSLMDHVNGAQCVQTDYRLLCRYGFSTEWTRGPNYEITHLRVFEWPGECFNVGRLQLRFPELRVLEFINCSSLNTFKGHFDEHSKIEKLVMHGLTSLWEVQADMIVLMPELRELDLRNNVLRHMKGRLLRGPPRLDRVFLSDNKWDCSDGGLDWLAMERENGTVKRKIVDYHKLMCHQQLYRGKPLHKVMDIIRMMRQTCPEPCECEMTHVVADRAGAVIPLITVDCAGRGLGEPPQTLPPRTTTLRLEGNKISTIRGIIQNPHYQKLADLYLDNNSISAVKELDGSEWFTAFRVLSLRGNLLKQIPVYAFDKALQGNNNIMHVFLGHNPWRCDCHFIPRFQGLLLKYRRVIRDLQDIRCSKSDDKTISLAQISTMPLGNVCRSGVEMPISTINIVNISLTALILLVIGRFLYDWHSFKTTGKLPWLSSTLP
ncbi:protein singed wings 2 [Pectinophora gossypiella]|uniref:protein singed wings 2 n=1 Tax=Pectinophora gossypiella TaxID=13191 RepID=UPI00214F1962|nr:protein singed wings 2 [Pectinophora gossypiella]